MMSMDVEEFPDVVEMNVGGKILTTLLSTLRKEGNSMLAAMFSGRHRIAKDKHGRYFIDYDGNVFENILNYLRHGLIPPKEKALEVFDCAVYFGIDSLIEDLKMNQYVLYRKRITDMKERLDGDKFNKLKQEATRILNNEFHPSEDKYFAFTSEKCRLNKHESGFNLPEKYIPLQRILWFNMEAHEEYTRCLAYDLGELGFGEFCYYNTLQLECRGCPYLRCNIIALRNEKWKDHYANWKMP